MLRIRRKNEMVIEKTIIAIDRNAAAIRSKRVPYKSFFLNNNVKYTQSPSVLEAPCNYNTSCGFAAERDL